MVFAFVEIVLEEVAVVLEEEDVVDVAIVHAEVHWLVGLCVLYSLYAHEMLGLPPIPQRETSIHIIGEHMFAIYAWFGYAIQQTPDPLRPPNSARISRKHELLAICEEFYVVGGRSDEVDVDGFAHAHIVLNDGVGDGDDVGGDRVC